MFFCFSFLFYSFFVLFYFPLFADKSLYVPNPLHSSIIGYASGVRPYRHGGIRIERENFYDKCLIHNYGHGGAGISLSWGSAQEAVNVLFKEMDSGLISHLGEVAVIGSGVIGLTTAYMLLEQGFKVHIYAKDFPPNTTSNVAGAIWDPLNVCQSTIPEEQEMFCRVYNSSLNKFLHLALDAVPDISGVRFIDVYSFKKREIDKDFITHKKFQRKIPTRVILASGDKLKGVFFNTMVIDTSIYMNDLFQKVISKGAVCKIRTFKDLDEVQKLSEKVIFNCSGLGSKILWNDKNVFGVRGQIIYLKKEDVFDYVISAPKNEKNLDIYFIPQKERIVLGGSFEDSDNIDANDPSISEGILSHVSSFFHLQKVH